MFKDLNILVFFRLGEDSVINGINQNKNLSACLENILKISDRYGFSGNLWKLYITYSLICSENVFTKRYERKAVPHDSYRQIAMSDIAIIREIYNDDLSDIRNLAGGVIVDAILDFHSGLSEENESISTSSLCNVRKRIMVLNDALSKAESDEEFAQALFAFYEQYGMGMFSMNQVFYVESGDMNNAQGRDSISIGQNVKLTPSFSVNKIDLNYLVGYDIQKNQLVKNTESFINGKPSLNVLLYGDAGAGKSTSIQALIGEYEDRGLRLIQVHKDQFIYLPAIYDYIKQRNYRFIILMDDLSFEEDETEYKYLKAVIEGGAQVKPENILIYATSNRRHLVKETWKDKSDMEYANDLHHSDTMEEKLSLAGRFGLSIHYPSPSRKEYHAIVLELAKRAGIAPETEEEIAKLYKDSDAWEIRHGGVSGRCARQFIDYLTN